LARHDKEDEKSYKERILNDLKTSRDLIRQHIGKESISLSYPYGVYDKTVVQLAKEAGFKLHVTIKTDKNLRDGNLMINRINAHGDYSGEQLVRKLNS
jgi:biofilm PGA synthesis lipoprotein PgaB